MSFTPATDIDEAIAFSADAIATVSYDPAASLSVQFALWIPGTFTTIFPPEENSTKTRTVTDWLGAHLLSQNQIEGPGNTDSGVVGTSAVIGSVTRVLSAVKFANINNYITQAQEDAMVDLFNLLWC